MVLSARLAGYQGQEHYGFSILFEYLHAATLLHDDVVDNAQLRRQQPAANTIWGNAAAVLVGDFLLATSFARAVAHGDLRILSVLSATTTTMAEGEILQLINSGNLEITPEEYLQVITRKTAILIAAACQSGAIFGGAPPAQEEALHAYGLQLGIAFQLRDDVLDYIASEQEVGKPVGHDLREGKITLPLIHALQNSAPEHRRRLIELLDTAAMDLAAINAVKSIVDTYGGIAFTDELARRHAQQAKEQLAVFPPSPTRDLLEEISDYVVYRRQ